LKDLAIGGKNIQITVLDIFRDLCILMAEGSAPALKIVADHQSVLHDEVFVKFNKPNHSFGAELMKEVRMLQSSLNFFRIMLEMSRHVLDSAEQRLLDFNEKVTSSTFREICAQFDFSLLSVNALGDELNKIDTSLRDSINHRNNKVSLALSIAATIFLPLNFLTGIFGMNFSNGGLLVMVLSQDNGTDIFYALSIFWILLTLVSLYALGFLEMLTEKETNKKGLARVFNFHRLQEKGILDT
jgi:Mg2+ and Co2+ transporter CorA